MQRLFGGLDLSCERLWGFCHLEQLRVSSEKRQVQFPRDPQVLLQTPYRFAIRSGELQIEVHRVRARRAARAGQRQLEPAPLDLRLDHGAQLAFPGQELARQRHFDF